MQAARIILVVLVVGGSLWSTYANLMLHRPDWTTSGVLRWIFETTPGLAWLSAIVAWQLTVVALPDVPWWVLLAVVALWYLLGHIAFP